MASAETDNIVEGFGDGTFSGDRNITVEQMLALAARTLRERKGYVPPENAEIYLSSFVDADQVAGWARDLVAQTVRDEILERLNALNPQEEVSRSQAALILYRLFLRLYEVSPVALELPPAVEADGPETTSAPEKDDETDEGQFPVAATVIAGVLVLGAGAAGGFFVAKKRKTGNDVTEKHPR